MQRYPLLWVLSFLLRNGYFSLIISGYLVSIGYSILKKSVICSSLSLKIIAWIYFSVDISLKSFFGLITLVILTYTCCRVLAELTTIRNWCNFSLQTHHVPCKRSILEGYNPLKMNNALFFLLIINAVLLTRYFGLCSIMTKIPDTY